MGRQAHTTRLALGRSPFEDPLRDEDGNFFLGPRAHEYDAAEYKQQFDDRGHPRNSSSRAAASRLRRAQNDVLETVGVAVRKGEERKTKWERLNDAEKKTLLYDDNDVGKTLQTADQVFSALLSWPVAALRKRLMTFTNYSSLPLTAVVSKEVRLLGYPSWCLSGLLNFSLSQTLCFHVREFDMDHIVGFVDPWDAEPRSSVMSSYYPSQYLVSAVMTCIELPLLVHTTLQALHIIPATTGMSWGSFVPFTATSPVGLPRLPSSAGSDTIVEFAVQLTRTPLLLYLCHDYIRTQLGYRFLALFKQLITTPDRPDSLSTKVFDGRLMDEAPAETSVGENTRRNNVTDSVRSIQYFGPRTFFGALRMTFPPIYKLLNIFSQGRLARSRGTLSHDLERRLKALVMQQYWEHRSTLEDQPRRGSPRDMVYQQWAFEAVFRSVNVDPVAELVDPRAWINDVLGPKADVKRFSVLLQQTPDDHWNDALPPTDSEEERPDLSQYDEAVSNILAEVTRAVPVFDVIIIQATDGQAMVLARASPDGNHDLDQMENIRTIDAGEVPLEAFIRGARNLNQISGETPATEPLTQEGQPQAEGHATSPPLTPIPGISRAISLSDSQFQLPSQSQLRPLRRPTETDDSLAAISRTLRAEAEALQSPHPSAVVQSPTRERSEHSVRVPLVDITPSVTPMKYRHHRVTMLSRFAAYSLAWHSSAMLTSFLLWPLEAMWLRSVASWALQNPGLAQHIDPWWSARLGFGVVGRPVTILSLSTWFGGAHVTSERFKYIGAIMLTMGLEGIIRGACWRVGVWYVKAVKDQYGWGQF